jgi:hypothetical protein
MSGWGAGAWGGGCVWGWGCQLYSYMQAVGLVAASSVCVRVGWLTCTQVHVWGWLEIEARRAGGWGQRGGGMKEEGGG